MPASAVEKLDPISARREPRHRPAPPRSGRERWPAAIALSRQTIRDARVRDLSYAAFFAVIAFVQPVAYRRDYPTLLDRLRFAHSFAGNTAIRLFYGAPRDLLTIGGYSAWRVGGVLAIVAAVWGIVAAVRALRAQEDAGRMELVLAGAIGRGSSFAAVLAALGVVTVGLFAALLAGLLAGGLPLAGSAYLALATVSVIPVFVGVGALVSQLAPSRRLATELGCAIVAIALLVRVVADTSASFGALSWCTPLGWAEQLRPFAGPRPIVLLLPVGCATLLIALSARLAARRDVGSALIPSRDRAAARSWLLESPAALALRLELSSIGVWIAGTAVFGLILGAVSRSISASGISPQLQRQLAKLGAGPIVTPKGYLGLAFLFFVLAVSLFCCAQLAAARREEAEQRLETLTALPVDRRGWLGGRLLVAGGGAIVIAVVAGACTWVGATSQGVPVGLADLLAAGANCLPTAALFLGLGALAVAVLPRAGVGLAYGLVSAAFAWQLFGALLGAPGWLLDLSPFEHVAPVPAAAFRAEPALAMIGVAVIAGAIGLWAIGRRDLASA